MTALGKYRVVQALTRESLKTHRLLIEEALKKRNLPPVLRAELEEELRRVLAKEIAADSLLPQILEDEEDEEEEEDGSDSSASGGAASGGGSSGGGGGGMGYSDGAAVAESDGLSGMETIALLFFLAEQDVAQPQENLPQEVLAQDVLPQDPQPPAPDAADLRDAFPLAAATLLFSPEEKIAHVHEPYTLALEGKPNAPSDLLPALEKHAAARGAHIMQLKVHADAVALFKQKGYQPLGTITTRRGTPIQKMRRDLTYAAVPTDMS